MCIKFNFIKDISQITLKKSNCIFDTFNYINDIGETEKLTIVKDKNKTLSFDVFNLLIKNNLGIEKIEKVSNTDESVIIVTEKSYNFEINNSELTVLDIAYLGMKIINSLKRLYKMNVRDFKLSFDSLSLNKNQHLIIKDYYIYSDDSNHLSQLSNMLNTLYNQVNKYQDSHEIEHQLQKIINKSFSNDFYQNISDLKKELTYFVQLYTPLSLMDISITNPYSSAEIKYIQKTGFKCDNFINEINADKIINFNFKNSDGRSFLSYKWLFELEEKIETKKSFYYHNKGVSFKEALKVDENFSGIVIINGQLHIFIYKGYLCGAVNSELFITGDDAIKSIDYVSSIEYKENNTYLALVILSLVSKGVSIIEETEFTNNEIIQIIDSIQSTKFTGHIEINLDKTILSVVYDNGKNIFSVVERDKTSSLINIQAIKKSIFEFMGKIELNVFNSKIDILNYSLENILLETQININKKYDNSACLENVLNLGNEHLHQKLKDSIIKNILIKCSIPCDEKINIFNGELDINTLVKNTIGYKFLEWLLFNLFFQIKENGLINEYKNIYKSIPLINKISFSRSDIGELRIFLRNNQSLLFIVQIGNSSFESLNSFVDSVNIMKQSIEEKSLISAFYVSEKNISNEVILKYKDMTKVSSFKMLSNKQKNYVRISNNLGYSLFLVSKIGDEFFIN